MSDRTIPEPTARLLFEPLSPAHADELRELTLPDVARFIGGEPSDLEALRAQFVRMAEGPSDPSKERWVNFAVRSRASGVALGRVEAAVIGEGATRAEVAYLLIPSVWGQGLAREAMEAFQAALVADFAVEAFWATVTPGNQRSVRLLQRLGYVEHPREAWPALVSYDEGDLVFARRSRPTARPSARVP